MATTTLRLCGTTQTYPQEVEPGTSERLHNECQELIGVESNLTAESLAEKVVKIFDDSRGILDVLSMGYLKDKDNNEIDPISLKQELAILKDDMSKVKKIMDNSFELFQAAGAQNGFLKINKSDRVNYHGMCMTLRGRVDSFDSYLKKYNT